MREFEEDHELSSGWSWFILVLFCAFIISWGLMNFALIKDGPREWNFGALPDAPSQSIYSSEQVPEKTIPPRQVAPLPESKPRGMQTP